MEIQAAFNQFDWVVIACALLGLFYGYIRGLLGLAVGMVGYLAALVAAGRFAEPLVAWADGQFAVVARTAQYVGRYLGVPAELHHISVGTVPPDRLARYLALLPLPTAYKGALVERMVEMAVADPTRSVADLLFRLIATGILSAVAFFVLVVAVNWGLRFTAARLGFVLDKLPLVGGLNHWLGALASVLMVGLSLVVLTGLLAPLLTMPSLQGTGTVVNGSVLAPYLLSAYDALAKWIFGQAGKFFLGLT